MLASGFVGFAGYSEMMRDLTPANKKRPALEKGRGVITVYGHRLSSLYRRLIEPWFGFDILNLTVSKILEFPAIELRYTKEFLASGGSISETVRGAER